MLTVGVQKRLELMCRMRALSSSTTARPTLARGGRMRIEAWELLFQVSLGENRV
tara:strand:- start:486 stop:647 length:162 start_codon:yes stop_codon:yes gene_type:complete